jgi:hypothetical protein
MRHLFSSCAAKVDNDKMSGQNLTKITPRQGKPMKKAFTIPSMVALGLASTASAQLQISNLHTPNLINFDAYTPGIYVDRAGSGPTLTISEPNAPEANQINPNRASTLRSDGVATSQSSHEGFQGQGNGSPTRFANDGNGNGSFADSNIGFSAMRVFLSSEPEASGLTSNAFRLALNNDGAENAVYFRIWNDTGEDVPSWNFKADFFVAEPDANNFSTLQFAYAVSNNNNPGAMTFTTFGTPPTITSGLTLSGTPFFQLNATVNAMVNDQGYIVLRFRDTASGTGVGSTIFIDNIEITAIPEPSTYALMGLGLAALFALRRFSSKSS